ncbi:porin, partial [Pseudomonas sp. GW460-13]
LFRMSSGGLSGSRWGLRGVEDLGSGLKALFVLESGFGLDDGKSQQGGRLFGRQAYVGLESDQVGRVTFGRQYTSLFDMMANFSPTGYAT